MTVVLLVDDEPAFLESARRALRLLRGIEVHLATSSDDAIAVLEHTRVDVAFLDVTMPGTSGLDLLAQVAERWPAVACVMVTARDDVPTVMRATRLGAVDYLVKPIVPAQLEDALERARERARLGDLVALAQGDDVSEPSAAFAAIATCDARVLRVLREAELHARSDIPVLVRGETGTGKELVARAVHAASPRRDGPFVAVNMLSITSTLFESELFGHKRGAFTGATADRDGHLQRARRGTLFLDEIGDLSPELQGKLLRLLQEGEVTPVGGTVPVRADVRFVAATHQDLEALVNAGRFRRDLFYRLRFAQLTLPPLRARPDDVILLATRFARASSRPDVRFSESATAALMRHDWPGNVRELKGVVEAAANLAEGGWIQERHLSGLSSAPLVDDGEETADTLPLAEVERRHVLATYLKLARNKTRTARALAVSIPTLVRKLRAYGED